MIISRKTKDPIVVERQWKPAGTIKMTTQTRDGIVTDHREFPMHSMTQNYWRIIASQMGSNPASLGVTVGSQTLVRLSGATSSLLNSVNTGSKYYGVSGVGDLWGLRVGTDDTPVKMNDLTLGGLIAHGSSAGQLNHLETFGSATSSSATFTRAFENLSGSAITIKEMGICLRQEGDAATATNPFLFARDILPTPYELGNNEIVTIVASITASEGTQNMHNAWTALTVDVGNWSASFTHRDNASVNLGAWIQPTVGFAGDNLKGIFFGTGDTAVSFSDIDLATRLPQGSGSGQLLYGDTNCDAWEITNTEIKWQTRRTISNSSGEDYVIREAGVFGSPGTNSYLYDRFLFQVPLTLKNGENREVRYRFSYSL